METPTQTERPVSRLLNSINLIIDLQAQNLKSISEGKTPAVIISTKDWDMVLKMIDKIPNFTMFEKIANGEEILPDTKIKVTKSAYIDETGSADCIETAEPAGNVFELRSKAFKERKLNGKADKN